MAAATTTYDVITRYLVKDEGSRPVQQLTHHVQTLERSASSSMGILGKLGGAFAGYLGFQQAKKSLIDFNSNMEQSKITMAGLMEQAGRGNYAANFEEASKLVKQMQLDARASIGTTADFVDMASQLIQPLTMAGGSMENLRDMTRQTVVASKSMGIEAGVAARDIDQAIRGQYKSVDPFSGKLLTPLGYGGEEGRKKFNAMNMQARMSEIQRALASPAIAAMAKAQETSYSGAASTALDNVQMFLGRVGVPLFKGITAELNKWNTWLDKNQNLVDQIAKDLGGKILSAAVAFRDAIGFAAEHWKQIAGAVAMYKSAGVLMAMPGAAGAGASALGGFGAAGGIGGKLAVTSIIASGVYIGATSLVDYISDVQSKRMEAAGRFDDSTVGLFEAAKSGINGKSARAFAAMAKMQGLADDKGNVSQGTILAGINTMGDDQRQRLARALELPARTMSGVLAEEAAKQFAVYIREAAGMRSEELMSRGTLTPPMPRAEKAKVNVTINRIEVASDDPDRFAFGMVKAFRKAAKDPGGVGSNIHALSEG